jgi:hypothetical protein
MSRKVRRVPPDWQHPRDDRGCFIPMHEQFPYVPEEVEEGLRKGWLRGEPPHYNIQVVPQCPLEERTHYQLYEEVTEGTPVTPHFETKGELIEWLVTHGEDYGDGTTSGGWSRQAAEQIVNDEWAPSLIISNNLVYRPQDGKP